MTVCDIFLDFAFLPLRRTEISVFSACESQHGGRGGAGTVTGS